MTILTYFCVHSTKIGMVSYHFLRVNTAHFKNDHITTHEHFLACLLKIWHNIRSDKCEENHFTLIFEGQMGTQAFPLDPWR